MPSDIRQMKKPGLGRFAAAELKQQRVMHRPQRAEQDEPFRKGRLRGERSEDFGNAFQRADALQAFDKKFVVPDKLEADRLAPQQDRGHSDQQMRKKLAGALLEFKLQLVHEWRRTSRSARGTSRLVKAKA